MGKNTLPRPASLPDVRLSPNTSTRPSLIATLEPFMALSGASGKSLPPKGSAQDKSVRQRCPRTSLRKPEGSSVSQIEVMPGMYEPVSFEKYIVVKSVDGCSINDLDIFEVHRSLVKACGREPKIMPQGDGSLLVEVSSPEESSKLRALTSVPGATVSCSPHATMNQSRGVVFSRDLLRYSEERLVNELKNYDVTSVRRVQRKVDGVLTPTPTLFITFNRLVLPKTLKLAWLNLNVKPYVPNPRRCFHCQAYGHVTQTCRRLKNGFTKICVSCGMDNHGDDCPGPVRCYHCGEPHPASSKDCERYRFEREVLNIRNQERVSFAEAKQLALNKISSPGMTYAAALNAHAHRRSTTVKSVPPTISILPEKAASSSQMPADGRSEPHQQKRTRSEESLGDTPPAKVPSPAPASGSPKESRVPAVAATPASVAPTDPQPVTAAAQGHGAVPPAPVSSASAQSVLGVPPVSPILAASSEWRKVEGGRVRKSPAGTGGRGKLSSPRPVTSAIGPKKNTLTLGPTPQRKPGVKTGGSHSGDTRKN